MIRTPEKVFVGTPPVGDHIIYVDTDGVARIKASDSSDFRLGAGITPRVIPLGMHLLIPVDQQLINFGGLTVDGAITVDGDLVIL